MFKDPQMVYVLFNVFIIVVVGFVGWLLKRAITGNDSKVDTAIDKIEDATKAVASLQLLIVGDYLPRREHIEHTKHVEQVLEQLRNNVHNLRTSVQTNATKIAILEGAVEILRKEKTG